MLIGATYTCRQEKKAKSPSKTCVYRLEIAREISYFTKQLQNPIWID